MKILAAPAHYHLSDRHGSELSWPYEMMRHLAPLGVDFTAVTQVRPDLAVMPDQVSFRVTSPSRQRPRWHSWDALRFAVQCYCIARRELRADRVDVIHHMFPFGHGATFNLLPVLGDTCGKPFVAGPLQVPQQVVDIDGAEFLAGRKSRTWDALDRSALRVAGAVLRSLQRRTLDRADLLVAINGPAKELYGRLTDTPIVVIPAGIDPSRFPAACERSSGHIEILTIAYLLARKRIDILIKAVAHLIPDHPGLRLCIVGDGPQRPALEELVGDLGMGGRVSFEGTVDNSRVSEYYRRADIFATTSLSESFGVALLEAMSSGIPVVSADNVGARSILHGTEAGMLVPRGEIAPLEKALAELISRPSLRQSMAAEGQKLVLGRYSWRRIAQDYHRAYLELMR